MNIQCHPGRNIILVGTRASNLAGPKVVGMVRTNLPIESQGLMAREINPIYSLSFLGPYNLSIVDTENKMAIGLSYTTPFMDNTLNLERVKHET